MPIGRKRLHAELVKAADRFIRIEPWKLLCDVHAFAIRVPGAEHPLVASILGSAGMEFGLGLVAGPSAVSDMARMITSTSGPAVMESLHTLNFTMTPLGDIHPSLRRILEDAGFRGRRETPAPFFLVKEPSKRAKEPGRQEAEILLFAINGIVNAVATGLIEPKEFIEESVLQMLDVSGDPLDPDVEMKLLEKPPGSSGVASSAAFKDDPPPADDDLDGWKDAERSFVDAVIKTALTAARKGKDDVAKYIGRGRRSLDLIEKYMEHGAMQGFIEWRFTDFRQRPGSMTLAEAMLKKPVSRAHGMLAQARLAVAPSVFSIVSTTPGTSLMLEDVILGGRYEVHDKSLSECTEAGLCLVGRVFRAGAFNFITKIGPELRSWQASAALDYLEKEGLVPTREGLVSGAHLFGRLWGWIDEAAKAWKPPVIVNTEGDRMEWTSASFSVEDEKAARAAIAARFDVEHDEAEDSYVWFDREGKPGGRTVRGNMKFICDELVLDVNSAERLKTARSWLETIPGVRFKSKRTRDLVREAREGGPPDDVISASERVEPPADVIRAAQDMLSKMYRDWVDHEIPALGGLSPRQACRTDEGRRKVEMLIRTIAVPGGGIKVDIEKVKRMIRATLGLADR